MRHSIDRMFAYHCGALSGSPANAATTATGLSISAGTSTSTFILGS
ncbi:hypothetical protein ACOCJ5_06460 [Knoellia sp. CPCC 206450]